MVALLIVSHSAQLADGVAELARQMAPDVPIVAAGGTDEGEIGTSFDLIFAALQSLVPDHEVLVLMDLGSAVLTTETALDFLDDEQRDRVRMSGAPLVEGAVAAATTAGGGADLDEVAAAARQARQMHKVGETEGEGSAAPPEAPADGGLSQEWLLPNPAGLHARPAAMLVRALRDLDATLTLENLDRPGPHASARSVVEMMGLACQQDHRLRATATGPDAEAALERLDNLVRRGFDEMDAPPLPASQTPGGVDSSPTDPQKWGGIAASPGIAIGPAFHLKAPEPVVPDTRVDDPAAEVGRLDEALRTVSAELAAIGARGEGIFEAQQLLMEDPALRDSARDRIRTSQANAAAAWYAVTGERAEQLEAIDDPLFAARAADLRDVGRRVVTTLVGEGEGPELPEGVIVLTDDLVPSQVLALHDADIAGIVTTGGGATSHAAILARALGIPALVALRGDLSTIPDGTTLVLDAGAGRLRVDPTDEEVAGYRSALEAAEAEAAEARRAARDPAITRAGRRVIVAANAASVAEAEAAVTNGAEGIGLLRTEFLYLGRPTLPSEDEQVEALRPIFAAMAGRPVIVRTLDAGGDKPIPALDLDAHTHGFLGVRGLRYSLRHPDLFRTQLRAILRAAAGHRVSLMFPMVSTVEEIRAARDHLDAVIEALEAGDDEWAAPEEIGIMVEVPAAALAAEELADEVDFFSVGSNDLTQYTFAAERTLADVAELYRPAHPAMRRLLRGLIERAHDAGKWVGLCGEMAGDPDLTATLVDLGFDELSVAPAAVPQIKAGVRVVG